MSAFQRPDHAKQTVQSKPVHWSAASYSVCVRSSLWCSVLTCFRNAVDKSKLLWNLQCTRISVEAIKIVTKIKCNRSQSTMCHAPVYYCPSEKSLSQYCRFETCKKCWKSRKNCFSSAAAPQRKYRFPLRKARILPASPNFVCDGRMETSDAAECSPNIPPDNDPCPTKIAHQTSPLCVFKWIFKLCAWEEA